MKKFELIRPKSLNDEAYEDYEYLIRWVGRDGSEYLYMFYDAEIENRVNSEIVNPDDNTYIQSIISENSETVTLSAEDLSLSDLNIIKQIYENPFVWRIFKDDSEERFAPEGQSKKYRLKDGRYKIEFTLRRENIKVWR